ncbi:hypothetical protein B0E41_01190 [Hydrogenophaga sp. A37]|nr:hypothetical protein B0E41_01190 [Hydrogenophaga sp. A37]
MLEHARKTLKRSVATLERLARQQGAQPGHRIALDSTFVKVVAWYDNEWGCSNKCLEMARGCPGGAALAPDARPLFGRKKPLFSQRLFSCSGNSGFYRSPQPVRRAQRLFFSGSEA